MTFLICRAEPQNEFICRSRSHTSLLEMGPTHLLILMSTQNRHHSKFVIDHDQTGIRRWKVVCERIWLQEAHLKHGRKSCMPAPALLDSLMHHAALKSIEAREAKCTSKSILWFLSFSSSSGAGYLLTACWRSIWKAWSWGCCESTCGGRHHSTPNANKHLLVPVCVEAFKSKKHICWSYHFQAPKRYRNYKHGFSASAGLRLWKELLPIDTYAVVQL